MRRVAAWPGRTSVVESSSSMIAGPSRSLDPARRSPRRTIGVVDPACGLERRRVARATRLSRRARVAERCRADRRRALDRRRVEVHELDHGVRRAGSRTRPRACSWKRSASTSTRSPRGVERHRAPPARSSGRGSGSSTRDRDASGRRRSPPSRAQLVERLAASCARPRRAARRRSRGPSAARASGDGRRAGRRPARRRPRRARAVAAR